MRHLFDPKKLAIFIFTFGLICTSVQATESDIQIRITQSVQDPETKEFRLTADITSQSISSQRVSATWHIPEGFDTLDPTQNNELSITPNQNTQISMRIKPTAITSTDIELVVEAFEDTNTRTIATQRGRITVNSELEISPNDPNYLQIKNFYTLKKTSRVIMSVSLAVFLILIIFKRLIPDTTKTSIVGSKRTDSKILAALNNELKNTKQKNN